MHITTNKCDTCHKTNVEGVMHLDQFQVAVAFICGSCDPKTFASVKAEPECRFNCECHLPNHKSCNINGGCDCPSIRNNGHLNDEKKTVVMSHFVSIWGSHPDQENDDCWTGQHFRTMAEARAAVETLLAGGVPHGWSPSYANDFAWVELDSTDLKEPEYFENKGYAKRRAQEDRLDRSEARMQAGMSFGVQGWNDFEGC